LRNLRRASVACACSCAVAAERRADHWDAFALGNYELYGGVKDLMYTNHLFAGALHVHCTHFVRDGLALSSGHWCETLCFEEVDACALVAEI